MNPTENSFPTSTEAIAGFATRQPLQDQPAGETQKAIEGGCIDLMCRLECLVEESRQLPRVEFVDESATIARTMLEHLTSFTKTFLTGHAVEQATGEIARAMTSSYTYDEVLKTRSFSNAVIRTFWKTEETKEIQESHGLLGEALIRSCAATMYHAIMAIGVDSEAGKQIDQSTVVFVTELQEFWNQPNV